MPSPMALAKAAVRSKKLAQKAAVKKKVNAMYKKRAAKNEKRKEEQIAKKAAKKADSDDAEVVSKKSAAKKFRKTAKISTKPSIASKIKTNLLKKKGLDTKKKTKKLISTSKNAKRLHAKKSWSKVKVKASVDKKRAATIKKAAAKKA